MVAIVTGNGLGLERSSGQVLGSKGQLGDASFGTQGENVTVNAATGNLVIERTDEIVIGQGPDSVIHSVYNSLGSYNGLGANGTAGAWQLSVQRHLTALPATPNSANSTITLSDWDGSDVVYTYDASRTAYVSTEGPGAYDTITYRTSDSMWLWQDGNTRITETYGATGDLRTVTDIDGNTITYPAVNGTSATVTDATGYTFEKTAIPSGANLTLGQLTTTLSSGPNVTRTYYTYDSASRLAIIINDPAPTDNSIVDNNYVVTTYTYVDSTSHLISSIAQTGGARLDFTYDASNRVTSITQTIATGIGEKTGASLIRKYDRRAQLAGPASLSCQSVNSGAQYIIDRQV